MAFTRKSANTTPLYDEIFTTVQLAKKAIAQYGEENVINATIGSLYGEDNTIVAFDSVYHHYDEIPSKVKAAYGSIAGSSSFKKTVYEWVTQNSTLDLYHDVIASPGGTGAISTMFRSFLEEDQTIIIPDIAWGNYQLIASQNNIKTQTYSLFEDNHFNLSSIKTVVKNIQSTQDRIVFVINDPCQNPTGYSLTLDEWKDLIAFFNEVGQATPVVIINDIAYIDYSYDLDRSRAYMETFNSISEKVLITIAFSCSKSLTSYGLRCGASLILGKKEEDVKDIAVVFEKDARATWSNSANAPMENFIWVIHENKDAFIKEKDSYIQLLKERSTIFITEANQCGLEMYPYKEGFFITLKIEDTAYARRVKEALMQKNIFTIVTNKGIRVAICSLPIEKCKGLAPTIKQIMDSVE